MKSIKIIFIFLVSYTFSWSQIVPISKVDFQQKLEEIIATYKIPGMTATMVNSDKILNASCTGTRRFGHDEPIQIDDFFHLGSNTKAMTAFVAAALVEEGKIDWDTKYLDLFPALKKSTRPEYANITLINLFRHQARIQPYTEDFEWETIPKIQTNIIEQRRDWCASILQKEPVEIDSTRGFVYSNAGYTLAASMMEKVTNIPYEILMQQYFFDALRVDGGFNWPNAINENQPWGHFIEEKDSLLTEVAPDDEYKIGKILSPAGDAHMSIKDYGRYLQANINGLNGKEDILSPSSFEILHQRDEVSAYAGGWGIGNFKIGEQELTYSMHNGSGGTYYSESFIIHELGIGFAVFINAGDDYHSQGIKEMRSFILKNIKEQLLAENVTSK